MFKEEKVYDLDELIKMLETCYVEKDMTLNFPKAFLTICLELKRLDDNHEHLSDAYYVYNPFC